MSYIPELVYSKRGEFPELARHIEYAQNTKHLPGKHGTAKSLTRLTDKAKIKKNRGKACPFSRPRPAGKGFDEYPFASTWQGASTGSGQFSWRMIPKKQHQDIADPELVVVHGHELSPGGRPCRLRTAS